MKLDARIPDGPLADKWAKCRDEMKLISPPNRRKYHLIIVGSGLAGGAAAATFGEQGYHVKCFCFQDSPRRAHSIAAQGGINAAKNYQNDGDSVQRLFHDTIKGGDFRSREANVYRLAELSVNIIDQCVAQGVPFAREYGGLLANRSFGGAQVSRTFYARGQTGQQLLLGAYSALSRQIAAGTVKMYNRHEMMDLVLVDGHAKGIVTRNLLTGEIETWAADAVVLATGGYSNVYYLSTNAQGCNATAIHRAYKRGAGLANPCFTQIHPTCVPPHGNQQSKLTLMSESLRNDARLWVPRKKEDCDKDPRSIPEEDRDYFLERKYPSYGNLAPRDLASRAVKEICDKGFSVFKDGAGVYLDFSESIQRMNVETIQERYGNVFEMYERITGEDGYKVPMKIYPAPHYTMGGLWVDYHLMSNIPGLFVLGEANFSDHGANRLGASALVQGLADGYFIVAHSVADYLAKTGSSSNKPDAPAFAQIKNEVNDRIQKLLAIQGKRSPRSLHIELGKIMWEYCGMSRSEKGLKKALSLIPQLREEFWKNVKIVGHSNDLNAELERASRLADFLEFADVMCYDALERKESCGGHFREEYQTGDGEAMRDDANFAHVAIWEYQGESKPPLRHKEELHYKSEQMSARNYK